jgi:hypothetical protein
VAQRILGRGVCQAAHKVDVEEVVEGALSAAAVGVCSSRRGKCSRLGAAVCAEPARSKQKRKTKKFVTRSLNLEQHRPVRIRTLEFSVFQGENFKLDRRKQKRTTTEIITETRTLAALGRRRERGQQEKVRVIQRRSHVYERTFSASGVVDRVIVVIIVGTNWVLV